MHSKMEKGESLFLKSTCICTPCSRINANVQKQNPQQFGAYSKHSQLLQWKQYSNKSNHQNCHSCMHLYCRQHPLLVIHLMRDMSQVSCSHSYIIETQTRALKASYMKANLINEQTMKILYKIFFYRILQALKVWLPSKE